METLEKESMKSKEHLAWLGLRIFVALAMGMMLVGGCADEETERRPNVPTIGDEGTEPLGVPMIRLVVDAVENRTVRKVSWHVQADRPMDRDTFVLVRRRFGLFDVKGNVDPAWESYFVVLLTGHTKSESFTEILWWHVIKLPPPHERSNLLPRTVSYRDNYGITQKTQLRAERQFNEYRVGHPDTINIEEYVGRN